MTKVYIPTGNAVSLKNVAYTISNVFAKNRIISFVTEQFYPDYITKKMVDGVLFFYPCDPIFASSYVGYYVTFKSIMKDKILFYTTIEGKPKPVCIRNPVWKYVEFIANSKYTYEKLSQSGLIVTDIIPHGIDFSKIEYAKRIAQELRERRKKLVGDKVVFGYVGSTHVRKNVNGLVEAVKILNEKGYKNFVVNYISKHIDTPENMYKVAEMGKKQYEEILGFIGSCDFFITPTQSEGFCLPVLEAMAMEKIALHCDMPPINEYSNPDINITWTWDKIEDYTPEGVGMGGIIFEMHRFKPEKIAKAMEKAIDLYINNRDEYLARCRENYKIAKQYDANKIYHKFVELFTK